MKYILQLIFIEEREAKSFCNKEIEQTFLKWLQKRYVHILKLTHLNRISQYLDNSN